MHSDLRRWCACISQSVTSAWLQIHAEMLNSQFKAFKYYWALMWCEDGYWQKAQTYIMHTRRRQSQHTHTHTEQALSMIQGTLSFGSLSERIDFDLSGVDFQEQIIEPLNLICCLRGPQRTVITWWFGSEQPAPPRPLSLPHRVHKTWQITFNIALSGFVFFHACVHLWGEKCIHLFPLWCHCMQIKHGIGHSTGWSNMAAYKQIRSSHTLW